LKYKSTKERYTVGFHRYSNQQDYNYKAHGWYPPVLQRPGKPVSRAHETQLNTGVAPVIISEQQECTEDSPATIEVQTNPQNHQTIEQRTLQNDRATSGGITANNNY
jgi:hypothetical protein